MDYYECGLYGGFLLSGPGGWAIHRLAGVGMNIVAYGGGTNSTALLIECVNRGIPVALILFADTGGERPETYDYIKLFSQWLVDHNYPEITFVSEKQTLEEDCLKRKALPGIAYGFKSCSEHYKIRPQKRYLKAQGIKDYTSIVGIDADEAHRAVRDDVWYPLLEWDMGRAECIDTICKSGLPQPGKSSCYFCPSMRSSEIRRLNITNPELIKRALAMEENAQLTQVKGLGRSYSWKSLLATDDMFDDEFSQIDQVCDCYDG